MKQTKKLLAIILVLAVCFGLSACGKQNKNDGDEDYRAPTVIENAEYDPNDSEDYSEYFGLWKGTDDTEYDKLEITSAEGGMQFDLYKGDEIAASGKAQNVPDYAFIYFFNDSDGKAYQFAANDSDGMLLESFGTFVMKTPAPNTKGGFENIADVWYPDDENNQSYIEIDANGEWKLYQQTEDCLTEEADHGYIEQDHIIEEQYYAHSRQFDDVTYDVHMSFGKEVFLWGDDEVLYRRKTNDGQ